jgi:hypothetical protein
MKAKPKKPKRRKLSFLTCCPKCGKFYRDWVWSDRVKVLK